MRVMRMVCGFALACVAAPLAAQPIQPGPLQSGEITYFVRVSSAPDFTGRVAVTTAEFRGTDLLNVTGFAEVRVADMRTGIGARDSHLRGTLHADSLPLIRFDLVGVDPGVARGDTIALTFQGHLTLHGVQRTLRVPGHVVRTPAGTAIEARFSLDMREYGINPPVRLVARVQPVVEVTVRLSFR